MAWQPEVRHTAKQVRLAYEELLGIKIKQKYLDALIKDIIEACGALDEIARLEALLHAKGETIKTLRRELLAATTTSARDYDSGYRETA